MARKGKSKSVVVQTWRTTNREPGEDFTGRRSLAVPNQVLSVRELVDKFSRGILDLPEADTFYLNDDEIPNWEWLPKIEQLQYASELRHLIAQRKAEHERRVAEGETVEMQDLPTLPPQDVITPPEPPEDE